MVVFTAEVTNIRIFLQYFLTVHLCISNTCKNKELELWILLNSKSNGHQRPYRPTKGKGEKEEKINVGGGTFYLTRQNI